LGGQYSAADIAAWKAAFPATAVGAIGAVPEPAGTVIASMIVLIGAALTRRRAA
jgi:hypothetical protein